MATIEERSGTIGITRGSTVAEAHSTSAFHLMGSSSGSWGHGMPWPYAVVWTIGYKRTRGSLTVSGGVWQYAPTAMFLCVWFP